jgi:hypothetical protein
MGRSYDHLASNINRGVLTWASGYRMLAVSLGSDRGCLSTETHAVMMLPPYAQVSAEWPQYARSAGGTCLCMRLGRQTGRDVSGGTYINMYVWFSYTTGALNGS